METFLLTAVTVIERRVDGDPEAHATECHLDPPLGITVEIIRIIGGVERSILTRDAKNEFQHAWNVSIVHRD